MEPVAAAAPSGQKVMSARCILHGLNRGLAGGTAADYFPPEYAPLVAHISEHVEQVAATYKRDIDNKIKSVLSLPYSVQSLLFSLMALPGYDSYVLSRKAMTWGQIGKAMKEGCEQFVFLGTGFAPDPVLWSQSQPEKTFYSIDLPQSQEIMMAALRTYESPSGEFKINVTDLRNTAEQAAKIGENYYSIVHDLESGNTFSMLSRYGFKPGKKTFLLMEGLTVYLEEATVRGLLQDFKATCAEDSLALIGFMQKTISQDQVKAHAEAGEPYKFTLPLGQTPAFMNQLGLHMEGMFTSQSACALGVGSGFFNLYYGHWLSNELDENGIDPSTPEPYFLVRKTDLVNGVGLPRELYLD